MKFKVFFYTTSFIFIHFSNIIGQNWDTKILKVGYPMDIVYNTRLDRFFIALENKVIIVNPYLGSVEDSIVIGGSISNTTQIRKIAVSDDAQYLYFTKGGESKVSRYKLSNKSNDLEINIGEPISDLEVMPGRPQTIAVTRVNNRDVAIFDNTTRRQNTTRANYDVITNIIFAYNDSTTIFGSRDGISSNQFVIVKIDNLGATIKTSGSGLVYDFEGRFASSKDGFVYTNRGYKINLTAQKVPIKEGIYGDRGNSQIKNHIGSNYFAADPVQNKVYALVQSRDNGLPSDSTQLAVFNKTSFNLDTVYTLPVKFAFTGYKNELMEWGRAKLAIVYGDVFIIMQQCTPQYTTAPTILEGTNKTGCYDSLVTLTASGNFNRYTWSSGDTGRIVKIKNNFSSQSITVATIDTDGCTSPYSTPTNIFFEQKLEKPRIEVPNQRTTTCLGDSINLIANSYAKVVWSNGTTNSSAWFKQSGSYFYYTVSPNGCKSPISDAQSVTILNYNTPPRPTIKIENGDTLVCESASITLSAPIGYSLYKWSNGDNVRITTITPTNSQEITVRVSDMNGCESAPSVPIYLERISKPYTRPNIALNSNVLASSISIGNQWFLNGNPIQGATKQFFAPTQSGNYTVKYAVRGCFSDASNTIQF